MRLKASTTAKRRIGLLHSILSGLFEKVKTASNAAGKNYLAQLFRIPQWSYTYFEIIIII